MVITGAQWKVLWLAELAELVIGWTMASEKYSGRWTVISEN